MEKEKIIEILYGSMSFDGISKTELINIFSEIRYGVKKYNKGDVIVMRDEPCNELRFVLTGSVKGEMLDFSGKVVKIEDIAAPRPLASAFLFGKKLTYPVDIIANEKTQILTIPKQDVFLIMEKNRQFLTNFLNNISNRAQFLTRKLFFLSFKTIREKISNYLREQYRIQGNVIKLNVTQEALANLFGVTRPSLSRTLGEMSDEGIIKVSRKEIEIIDKAKLFKN